MNVTYDRYGRMNYNPDFHFNQKKPWTTTDEKFLIKMYEKIGPDEVSVSIGRTIHTVMQRAYTLRKEGRMPARLNRKNFRRNGREI